MRQECSDHGCSSKYLCDNVNVNCESWNCCVMYCNIVLRMCLKWILSIIANRLHFFLNVSLSFYSYGLLIVKSWLISQRSYVSILLTTSQAVLCKGSDIFGTKEIRRLKSNTEQNSIDNTLPSTNKVRVIT